MLPVALITGTNSGVGLALTVLMSRTHRVWAGMRSVGKRGDLDAELQKSGLPGNVKVCAGPGLARPVRGIHRAYGA